MKFNSEHRKNMRKSCAVPVEGKTGTAYDHTQTVDISQNGIGFVSNKPHSLNEQIAIELELSPGEEPALMMGKVKWVSRAKDSSLYRVGVQFEQTLLTGSRRRLGDYVDG